MQHAAVAQNLAEEVAKVADQLKDFELRAISAAGRGLTARADAAFGIAARVAAGAGPAGAHPAVSDVARRRVRAAGLRPLERVS